MNEESSDRAAAFPLAAAGYATTAPDYIGLGAGEGVHPYDDIPSEVSASVDALRASRNVLGQLDLEDVPIANSQHCLDAFRTNGADVTLIDLGDADHSASFTLSLPQVVEHFAEVGGAD